MTQPRGWAAEPFLLLPAAGPLLLSEWSPRWLQAAALGWIALFLAYGLRVRVNSRRADAPAVVGEALELFTPFLPEGTGDPAGFAGLLEFEPDLETAVADADVIVENAPENLELKQKVFKELDGIVKPDAIFTSNTSGFVIAEIARDVSPERKKLFAGMHFASPVPAMRMCEVIYTPETSPETAEAVKGVAEKAGKVVSMVKDMPGTYGFILNRVFAAARREADKIVADGIATREDVDKAMMTGRNWPVGFYNSRGTRTGWLE